MMWSHVFYDVKRNYDATLALKITAMKVEIYSHQAEMHRRQVKKNR